MKYSSLKTGLTFSPVPLSTISFTSMYFTTPQYVLKVCTLLLYSLLLQYPKDLHYLHLPTMVTGGHHDYHDNRPLTSLEPIDSFQFCHRTRNTSDTHSTKGLTKTQE